MPLAMNIVTSQHLHSHLQIGSNPISYKLQLVSCQLLDSSGGGGQSATNAVAPNELPAAKSNAESESTQPSPPNVGPSPICLRNFWAWPGLQAAHAGAW
jgi:hypothetical protein